MVRGFQLLDGSLEFSHWPNGLWSIVDVRFGHLQDWPLVLTLKNGNVEVILTFTGVVSFRAHEESEIINHWIARANEGVPVGLLYSIADSAYLDEFAESTSALAAQDFRHYLVAGYDLCVEVLAIAPPQLHLQNEGHNRA